MIACAVPACGYRVRMSCVVVEFRRLGMFTLGQGFLLFKQAQKTLVLGVFHLAARRAVQSETSPPLDDGLAGHRGPQGWKTLLDHTSESGRIR
jgi:hypothetical protein